MDRIVRRNGDTNRQEILMYESGVIISGQARDVFWTAAGSYCSRVHAVVVSPQTVIGALQQIWAHVDIAIAGTLPRINRVLLLFAQ